MNEHARMLPLLLILSLAFGGPLLAEETPMIGEVFLCKFHDGKDWNDLDVAIDVYNEAVRQAGIEPINEFVWRPFRGQSEFDFLWTAYSDNLNAWGRGVTGYRASPAGAVADAMFASMSSCDSVMTFVEQIYDSEAVAAANREAGQELVIEAYVCSFRDGKTQADLQAAVDAWHAYVTDLGLPMDVYRRDPLFGTLPDTDVAFMGVHPDIQTFAATSTAYNTDPRGAEVQAGFGVVQRCGSSLWMSRQVSPPTE